MFLCLIFISLIVVPAMEFGSKHEQVELKTENNPVKRFGRKFVLYYTQGTEEVTITKANEIHSMIGLKKNGHVILSIKK